jgi:hypothetical protein
MSVYSLQFSSVILDDLPVIMIRSTHRLLSTTTMSRSCDFAHINISVLCRVLGCGPVQRVPHRLYLGLLRRTCTPRRRPIRYDQVSIYMRDGKSA